MAAFVYVGPGRGSAPPLTPDTNNSDVRLVVTPWINPDGTRACDTEVAARNNGTTSASCFVRLCVQTSYTTGYVLTQCYHDGQMSMTGTKTVVGGGAPKYFRTIGDVPATSSWLVGVVFVNNVFLNTSYYPETNPVCGVKIV